MVLCMIPHGFGNGKLPRYTLAGSMASECVRLPCGSPVISVSVSRLTNPRYSTLLEYNIIPSQKQINIAGVVNQCSQRRVLFDRNDECDNQMTMQDSTGTELPATEHRTFLLLKSTEQRASLYDPVRREILRALDRGQVDYKSEVTKKERTLEDGTRIIESTTVEKPVQRLWMTVPEILDSIHSAEPGLSLRTPICYYHLRKLQEQGLIEQHPPREKSGNKRVRGAYFRTTAQFFVHATAEASVGHPVDSIMPQHIAVNLREVGKKIRKTGNAGTLDYSVELDGVHLWFSAAMNLHDDGQSLVAVIRDITEEKKAEEALRVSEERYRELFQQSMDATMLCDAGATVVDVNKRLLELLGYSREEVLGSPIYNFITPEFVESAGKLMETVSLRGSATEELTVMRKDSNSVPVQCAAGTVEISGLKFYQVILRDIGENKE